MTDQATTALATPAEPALCIGGRRLRSRYFLAPLAGYTQLAFRRAVRSLGGLGLATTDLVHATDLVCGGRKSRALVATTPDDRPLSVQIFGADAARLVEAARWLEAHGYGGVDINMGCPMAKINGQGGGARLMCDVDEAIRMVARVIESVSIPVTVKMRLGWDRSSITAPLLARGFERVGAAAVTVHARTREQGFRGDVHLEALRATVEAVERMPVIGNGDVRNVDDALHMRRTTGCAAVAIGRGVLLDPWIFHRLERAERGEPEPWEPSPAEQIGFLARHFRLMHEQHGDYACILFRKFAGWYGARLGIPEDLEDRLRRFESGAEFEAILEDVRRRHGARKSAVATALVKVPNGPVERW